MNRRTFIKAAGLSVASLALPEVARASFLHREGGAQWGGFCRPRGSESFIQAIQRMEKLIQRKLDVTRHYLHWDGPVLTDAVKWSAKGGRLPFIALSTNGAVTWKEIADGKQDDRIKKKFVTLRKWGHQAVLCFDHEPESMANQYGAGTPDEFAAAYDHTHKIAQEVGATNLVWSCVLQGGTFHGGHGGPEQWFPRTHHILGSDGYNRHSDAWVSFKEIFSPGYSYALAQGKSFMVGEWGCQDDPRKPDWFRQAAKTMKRWPKLRLVIYTNEVAEFNDQPIDFRVNSSSESLASFRKIGHDSYFGGGR